MSWFTDDNGYMIVHQNHCATKHCFRQNMLHCTCVVRVCGCHVIVNLHTCITQLKYMFCGDSVVRVIDVCVAIFPGMHLRFYLDRFAEIGNSHTVCVSMQCMFVTFSLLLYILMNVSIHLS